nr:PREDICTED: uncharacterized protein LOC105671630 [Linepithema humile]
MYVTLIPFFLAANVVVNDRSEWTFGPEYSFNLQVTHDSMYEKELTKYRKVFSTVKCRPKMADSLFCEIQYFKTFDGQKELVLRTSVIFEMKFNEHGVERIFTNSSDPFKKELTQKIAQQLSTGVDVQRKFKGNSIYWGEEAVRNGDRCWMGCSITYLKPKINMSKQNTDFQLVILPMFDVKPDSSFIIKKDISCGCYLYGPNIFQIEFSGATQINNRFEGPIYVINTHNWRDPGPFQEAIQLTLESIQPAQNKLMDIFNGNWFFHNYK